MPHITVLRLSHRAGRDPRMSTHLGLTSRVYGAKQFLLAGDKDSAVLESLDDVKVRFGGEMETQNTNEYVFVPGHKTFSDTKTFRPGRQIRDLAQLGN